MICTVKSKTNLKSENSSKQSLFSQSQQALQAFPNETRRTSISCPGPLPSPRKERHWERLTLLQLSQSEQEANQTVLAQLLSLREMAFLIVSCVTG